MRLLTSGLLLCLFGLTAVWGWEVTGFARQYDTVLSSGTGGEKLKSWAAVPGVKVEGIETSLRDPTFGPVHSPALRSVELTTLLAVHPMSSQAWLSLAGSRFDAGRPSAEVNAALAMSGVTGPNEGAVMWHRGVFGLLTWNTLTPDNKRQTIADIAGAIQGGATGGQIGIARSVLATQSPAARSEIAQRLTNAGLSPAQIEFIGLMASSG